MVEIELVWLLLSVAVLMMCGAIDKFGFSLSEQVAVLVLVPYCSVLVLYVRTQHVRTYPQSSIVVQVPSAEVFAE